MNINEPDLELEQKDFYKEKIKNEKNFDINIVEDLNYELKRIQKCHEDVIQEIKNYIFYKIEF